MATPPPRPPASAALVVIAVSTVLYTIAWLALIEAGIFRDAFDGPTGTILGLVMLGTAVPALGLGYWYPRRRGWAPLGAVSIAVVGVLLGLALGDALGWTLAA